LKYLPNGLVADHVGDTIGALGGGLSQVQAVEEDSKALMVGEIARNFDLFFVIHKV